jgi:hypothetical protein
MPITILDYIKSALGEKDTYTPDDFSRLGVEFSDGCEHCAATLSGWNAYPSQSGYWRCSDCIGDSGFATVEEFLASLEDPGTGIICPACQDAARITEIRDHAFECGNCGATWSA